MLGKIKGALGRKKAESPPPATEPAPAPVPAAKTNQKAVTKPSPQTTGKPAPAVTRKPVEPAPAAEVALEEPAKKKGFLKGIFKGSAQSAENAPPKLANAKTAKPAPVKDLKPAKPGAALVAQQPVEEPKKKRGLFGLFRGPSTWEQAEGSAIPEPDKIERPADWPEHSVVTDDAIALYSFGPAQAQGPDTRLSRGTLVKVQEIRKGWALVQVHGGMTGYIDAKMVRSAQREDFKDPVMPAMLSASSSVNPSAWSPAAPPPDLPEHPMPAESDAALLLLPPLELEPKP